MHNAFISCDFKKCKAETEREAGSTLGALTVGWSSVSIMLVDPTGNKDCLPHNAHLCPEHTKLMEPVLHNIPRTG